MLLDVIVSGVVSTVSSVAVVFSDTFCFVMLSLVDSAEEEPAYPANVRSRVIPIIQIIIFLK